LQNRNWRGTARAINCKVHKAFIFGTDCSCVLRGGRQPPKSLLNPNQLILLLSRPPGLARRPPLETLGHFLWRNAMGELIRLPYGYNRITDFLHIQPRTKFPVIGSGKIKRRFVYRAISPTTAQFLNRWGLTNSFPMSKAIRAPSD